MKIVLKHILKNIWAKKMRSILITISLIIATTVFVLNLTLPGEIVLKMQETMRSVFGNCDISVSTVEEFSVEDLDIGNEEILYTGIAGAEGFISEEPVIILGTDIDVAKEMKMLGTDVVELKANEVMVTDKQAEEFGYKVSDKISITKDDKIYEFEIVKIVAAKGIMSLERGYPVFLADIDVVNEISGVESGHFNEFYIDVKNDDNVDEFADYIKDNNKNYIVEKLADIESIEESISFISYIMLMIFAMAAIMIFFVVSSLTKIIIEERMPVIGTFRSVGATKYKMNAILILENVVYGLIGGIIGSIAAYSINSNAASLFISTSGVELSSETSTMSIGVLILGVVFAVVLEFFISFKAILKANKKPIKDIIFNVQSTRYIIRRRRIIIGVLMLVLSFGISIFNENAQLPATVIGIVSLIVGIANLVPAILRGMALGFSMLCKKIRFATGVVAGKNIGYNKMIISSSRLIVVSMSLMIAILTVSDSFSKSYESFKYIWNADILVMNVSKSSDEYEKLKEMDGIKSLNYLYYYFDGATTYNENKKFNSEPCIVGLDRAIDGIMEFDYKIEDLKYNELLIDEVYAKKNNIKVNDVLKIKYGTLNKELEYTVKGFVNSVYFSSTRTVMVVDLQNYIENYTDIPIWLEIIAEEGSDLQKLKTELKDTLKEVNVQVYTFDEYVDEQEESTNSVMSLFYVIIGLAVVLSFIGIVNNQIIGFIQRRKEIAVLNSTCMSRTQLKRMLKVEILVANAIACAIAIIVGYLATGMIDSFLQGMSLYMDIKYNWMFVFKFVGIVYVVLMITLIIPSRRIKKMNVVDEIKYE